MSSVPLGFRFPPTEEELLTQYLRRKMKQEPLPCESAVIEREIYEKAPWDVFTVEDPWHTFKSSTSNVIYVFTKLKKMGAKKRVIRRAGCGRWDGRTQKMSIYNGQKQLIGFKKMLNFETGVKKDECSIMPRGHWTMHEYSLGGVSLDGLEEEHSDDHDYVICKIKRDDSKDLKRAPKHHVHEVSKEENPRHKKMRYDDEASTSTPQNNFDQTVTVRDHHELLPTQQRPCPLPNNTSFDATTTATSDIQPLPAHDEIAGLFDDLPDIQPLPTHDDDLTARLYFDNPTNTSPTNSCGTVEDLQQIGSFFHNFDYETEFEARINALSESLLSDNPLL